MGDIVAGGMNAEAVGNRDIARLLGTQGSGSIVGLPLRP